MKINEMEKLIGISKKNIRFYEEQGLLNPDRNHENGYRDYSMNDLEQLKRIKLFRKLSIPIEEIRSMQNSKFTLSECMERHLIFLQREEKNLQCTKEMCRKIIDSSSMLETLEVDTYLEVMEQMERDGISFKNVNKVDQMKKKGSMTSAFVIIGLDFLFILFCVFCIFKEPGSIPVMIIFILISISTIIGISVALAQRMKEIKGGEENEASKY